MILYTYIIPSLRYLFFRLETPSLASPDIEAVAHHIFLTVSNGDQSLT